MRYGRIANASLEAPIDLERRMRARVLGKKRGDAPRLRRAQGSSVQWAVGTPRVDADRGRQLALDLGIHDVRPIALDADQGCSSGLPERVVRIVATLACGSFHHVIRRITPHRSVD